MIIRFSLNGSPVEADVRPDEMLLEVLRRDFELTSVRVTCEIGVCGACTALIDGDPISTCIFLAPLVDGREITTVDGLGGDHPVQQAFLETHAMQCGYCTPGMVLTVKRLLEENPAPSEEEIKVYSSVHEIAGDLLKTGPRRESDEQRPGLEPKSAGPP